MPKEVRTKIVDGHRVRIYKSSPFENGANQHKRQLKGIKIIQDKIKRSCLNCSLMFEADGKFMRLCYSCKNREEFKCPDLGI